MKRKLIPVLILLAFLTACASTGNKTNTGADADFIANSYKSLATAGTTVDTAMKTIAALYAAKQLGEDVKVRAITAATAFNVVYLDAVDKLSAYAKVPTDASKLAAQTALATVAVQVAAIVALNIIPAK